MEQTLTDYQLPSDKLYIVSKYDSGQSFVTISVARPELFWRMMLISLHPVCQIVDWCCLFALLYISMDILLMYH